MRGFDIKEFKERVVKARILMEKHNLEILLITSPHNFRYFSGFDSYFWESPSRPWFLLLSLNNDPIAVIPSIGETALQKTWIKNIKTWQSPNPDDEGVSTLQDAILSIKTDQCLIGCEMGRESYLRMSINDFYRFNIFLKPIHFPKYFIYFCPVIVCSRLRYILTVFLPIFSAERSDSTSFLLSIAYFIRKFLL